MTKKSALAKQLLLASSVLMLAACDGGGGDDGTSGGSSGGTSGGTSGASSGGTSGGSSTGGTTTGGGTSGGSSTGGTSGGSSTGGTSSGGSSGGTTGGTTTGGSTGTSSGGTSGGSIVGGGIFNTGIVPTNVTQGGVPLAGRFVCTQGAQAYGAVTTVVGLNGLVGDTLTNLLNGLGASSVTELLNSVTEPNNVIDGNLNTFATFKLVLGLLTNTITSVDESVILPVGVTAPPGKFAVFGVSFPNGAADLSLFNNVAVGTFLNGTLQEVNVLDQTALELLGGGGSLPEVAFVGVKTNLPYDRVTIRLAPRVLSLDVGNAMRAYELCTDGHLVNGTNQ